MVPSGMSKDRHWQVDLLCCGDLQVVLLFEIVGGSQQEMELKSHVTGWLLRDPRALLGSLNHSSGGNGGYRKREFGKSHEEEL